MSSNLTALDYALLAVYLAVILAVGLTVGSRLRTGTDFFLAGRRLPWWAIGFSLVATDIGGTDIIGVGGAAYTYGLAVANFEWVGCVPAMIVAAFVFIPHFWRLGIYTIPEFMERRFNAAVRSALALCWVVFMACNLGVMLLASAKLMTVLLGWPLVPCILVTAALVGAYTTAGGLAAVVYTDVIQAVVLIGGCLLVVVLGLARVGGPAELRDRIHEIERRQAAPEAAGAGEARPAAGGAGGHLALILPVDTPSPFPWPGILFGLALVLSPAYWIGNQAIVQRSLGARTEFQAKAAYVWGAILKNIIPVVIVVPGLVALALFPDLRDGDRALPHLVARVLPAGARGVFLAAFLAALMSSVDSYLNSAATILTHDFYRRFWRPAADEARLLAVGRALTVVLVVWAVGFAFALSFVREGVYTIFQTLMAFFQGPALAVLLAGLFWRRATGAGALAGFLAGVALSVALFLLNEPAVYRPLGLEPLFQISEPFLYFTVWAFVAALAVVAAVSYATPPPPADKLQCLIGRRPE